MPASTGHARAPHDQPHRRRRRCARWLSAVVAAASVALTVGPLISPAQAIPEAEALKKLAVIPVFILVDSKGVPLPLEREKAMVLPLYLERTTADQELAAFLKTNPTMKAAVLPLPLNVAWERVAALNKTLKDRKLQSPVIPGRKDMEQARTLLRKQGLDDKTIREGLSLPVFFTKPLLTTKTSQGQRGLFFLDYASLEKALSTLPDRSKLEVQAADLSAVMEQIIKQKEDRFAFFPTPEYFRLVQQQAGKGKPSGPGQPSAPPPRP